ncbi:DNA alkylation repair protein [Engelhardtia mirabilis]|uniref:DNA alkylation repair enzyme n=1 Tax=Engelhardtia mirabilis TaxID=2528011 RepID=A0A518BRD7_9BACT|nr:hypothetical protein Pla133_46590 [Planctomycetes bacterium Pla133]QDV03865.1 hypothetical protein Pla86_46570 [Planctomycetes bacterium Pla86]
MTASRGRKGARRMAEIPPEVLRGLERGELETASLVEWLAIDQTRLLEHVLGELEWDLSREDLRATAVELSEQGIVARTAGLGRALGLATIGRGRVRRGRDLRRRLAAHTCDAVRNWACYAEQVGELSLAERLDRAQPFAADAHSGVREIAWLAVRDAIIGEPDQAVELLEPWTREADPNLRRFASEATRPRGVWCAHLRAFRDEPERALTLLEPLRSDDSKYVRDSVANWLNDASRDRPDFVVALTDRWLAESPTRETDALVRRALRTLRKAGA